MRVLVIEDEHKIAQAIRTGLEQESFVVDVAFDGESGYDLAASEEYDVIILDRMLPSIDGAVLCKNLRKEGIHTPILMLTAKGQIHERVEGLDSGADDYLMKPFAFEELIARVRALSRRPKELVNTVLSVGNLVLDATLFEVKRNNIPITLSSKEFSLLEYLMRHRNKILTKDQIIAHVWSYDSDILPNTVEVYIGYLRNKIDKPFKDKKPLLQTVRGFGYKISDKEQDKSQNAKL